MTGRDRIAITLGTAGHVDHGKTALVGALTGTRTDRLAEERRRGLSIELGYARIALPEGRAASIVDVPGHARFVRTMVAGATGIDGFLMVVAADDGVMPQTREHWSVLRGLDVQRGVVAITKSDAADPAPALAEAAELMPSAERVVVSVRASSGLDELVAALGRLAAGLSARAGAEPATAPARLHVDRAFTVHGAGTVVTGTLWSGTLAQGDRVAVLPERRECRIRSLEVHDDPVASAAAGQRVALNLAGVRRGEVTRGDVVSSLGAALEPSRVVEAQLHLDPADVAAPRGPVHHGERVQVHHGTRESPARLVRRGGDRWQLRLEHPLVAARGDRLIVRSISPPGTLGGGVVVEPLARRRRRAAGPDTRRTRDAPGQPAAARGDAVAARPAAPPPLSPAALALDRRLLDAGLEPPLDSELAPATGELAALRAAGRAVRVGPRLHFHATVLDGARAQLVAHLREGPGSITVAGLRDRLGTSRKFAQALLEHFDGEGLTLRDGDVHRLRVRRQAEAPTKPAEAPAR
jgi:selenocysteine-specific elongation factor